MTYRMALVIFAILLVTTAATLLWMGRVPFCECGIISLWSGNVQSNQNSQQFLDPYSFTHVAHGILFFWILRGATRGRVGNAALFVAAIALESGWEILENTDFVINRYREATISLDYYGDSIFNVMGDILVAAAGFLLAVRAPTWVTLAVLVGFEVMLAFWIRDGLFLNILMLIYPLEFVKDWQSGL